jgi:hypothetical protein
MNLEGLTEKRNKKGTLYYENSIGEIISKVCGKCGDIKALEDFAKLKASLGGRESTCKLCRAEYREANKEYHAELKRKWREVNKEHVTKYREATKERRAENMRNWTRNNIDKRAINQQRRRARKAKLEDTLTTERYAVTLEYFGNACAITGRTENLEKEHAIPLSIGHGGTTFGNCYPMSSGLNQSKFKHNIFEWFEANRQRFNLEQERFDRLIEWLGKANGMTVEEYRDYVYECHANPNVIHEDKAI